MRLLCAMLSTVCLCALVAGCGDESAPKTEAAGGGAAGGGAATTAKPGHIVGKITMADGSPIKTPGVKYKISINGVTGRGENVGFNPGVNPDGTFSLKLQEGLYHPAYGTITVPFEGKTYVLNLEPVDPPTGTKESAPGIVQNFVWKLTGAQAGTNNPEINNHTHWYGPSALLSYQTYREDKGSTTPLPDKSKLIMTLKPTSKLIDGSEAKTLTIERDWRLKEITQNDSLNDLPPANYEVTGVARLPDGSTRPMLLMGEGDYPKFHPSAKITLKPNESLKSIYASGIAWVTD